MIIQIMSRSNAIKYSEAQHDETAAIISISDIDKSFPVLENNTNNGIVARCKVKFDDVERGANNCITKTDALKIVAFVLETALSQDRLIVHCEAGVSRSAGVAAAIMKALTGDDKEVFNNPRYVPNMTCYRAVINAFYDFNNIDAGLNK